MTKRMGIKVLAEGVKDSVEYEFLKKHGTTEVQGFFLSAPLPPLECATFLTEKMLDQEKTL